MTGAAGLWQVFCRSLVVVALLLRLGDGQVDLIDMQSLGNDTFRWCCTYQDHGLKDMYVAPLRGKTMLEMSCYTLLSGFRLP